MTLIVRNENRKPWCIWNDVHTINIRSNTLITMEVTDPMTGEIFEKWETIPEGWTVDIIH